MGHSEKNITIIKEVLVWEKKNQIRKLNRNNDKIE